MAIVPLSRRYSRSAIYPAILVFGFSGLMIMAVVTDPPFLCHANAIEIIRGCP